MRSFRGVIRRSHVGNRAARRMRPRRRCMAHRPHPEEGTHSMSTTLSHSTPAPATSALFQPRTVLIATFAAITLLFVATTLRGLANPGAHAPAHDDRSSLLLDR